MDCIAELLECVVSQLVAGQFQFWAKATVVLAKAKNAVAKTRFVPFYAWTPPVMLEFVENTRFRCEPLLHPKPLFSRFKT